MTRSSTAARHRQCPKSRIVRSNVRAFPWSTDVTKCILSRQEDSMRWKPVVPVIAFVCAILGTATPLLAQAVQTSSLTGTIKDSTGAVLPGVTVSVSSPQQVGGVQTSVTDSQGVYSLRALRPGTYQMDAMLSGFRSV